MRVIRAHMTLLWVACSN